MLVNTHIHTHTYELTQSIFSPLAVRASYINILEIFCFSNEHLRISNMLNIVCNDNRKLYGENYSGADDDGVTFSVVKSTHYSVFSMKHFTSRFNEICTQNNAFLRSTTYIYSMCIILSPGRN